MHAPRYTQNAMLAWSGINRFHRRKEKLKCNFEEWKNSRISQENI
jgi:hypothetical protein